MSTPTSGKPSVSRRNLLKASATVLSAAAVTSLGTNFAHAAGAGRIKVGLVGCGGRGKGAAGNAVEADKDVIVKAVGDIFQDKAQDAAKVFGERPKEQWDIGDRVFWGFDAYQKVLATDIDYVILATPPGFRPMMIDAAIKAGKHIFAEKPVAVDAPGCRQIMAAGLLAKEKNLGIVAGTQRRHDPMYVETVAKIQEGALGRILAGQVYWIGGELEAFARKDGWSDLEWQLRNWQYFLWLSGDLIVEQHVHNIDIANWVIGKTPKLAIATGGRMTRQPMLHGHTYDHFAVDFEYPDGQHVMSMSRQQANCYSRVSEVFVGTEGTATVSGGSIKFFDTKKENFRRKPAGNPYVLEHADLIKSIKDGKPLNEAQFIAESVLTAVMGRMSAYTGQIVTWQQAYNSKETLMPEKLDFSLPYPMPEVPMPGKTKLG